jgi:hypothetical protein
MRRTATAVWQGTLKEAQRQNRHAEQSAEQHAVLVSVALRRRALKGFFEPSEPLKKNIGLFFKARIGC